MSGSKGGSPHPSPTPSHLEQPDDAIATVPPGMIQCRATIAVLRLSVRAAFEKQPDDRLATSVRRPYEGRVATPLQHGSTVKG